MTVNQRKRAFLKEVSGKLPEYGDIFALFREVFAYVDSRQSCCGVNFVPDASHDAERIRGGFPLLTSESLAVDVPVAEEYLLGLLDVLARHSRDGNEELDKLKAAVASGKLELRQLLGACLERERALIESAALACDVAAPLLEFVLETVLKGALEPFAASQPAESFSEWHEGYCPVCGSRAGMAELAGEEGKRYLCCGTCFFRWAFRRLQCPYCGNDDPQKLSYFTADDGPTRVDVCRKCSRYIKTRDSRLGHAEVPLEAEDLATIHLDLAAGREGFERGK